MNYQIVADSCCDFEPEYKKELGITNIPLTITMGEKVFVDDENLNLPEFMEEMKNFKEKTTSGAPSPALYADAFKKAAVSFAITISSNLSSSYSSAMIGKSMAEESGAEVFVFDSKSASAGETLIALKLNKLIKSGMDKLKIASTVENFIDDMKTYFVLEDLSTLIKNGRMGRITGRILTALNIKPILGSDGDGNIALYSHARGQNQIVQKLSDIIEKSGKKTEGEKIVIAHCNNPNLAQSMVDSVKERFNFEEVFVVATRGLSSMYANEKGIIIAF